MKILSILILSILSAFATPASAMSRGITLAEEAYKTWQGGVTLSNASDVPTFVVEDMSVHWTGDGSITCDQVRRGAELAHDLLSEQKRITADLNAINPNDRSAIARAESFKERLQYIANEIERVYPKRFDQPQIAVDYILKNRDVFGFVRTESKNPNDERASFVTVVDSQDLDIRRVSTNGYQWGELERAAGIPLTDGWGHRTYPHISVSGFKSTLFTRYMSPIEMCLGDNSITFETVVTFEVRDYFGQGFFDHNDYHVKKSLLLVVPNLDYNSLLHDDRARINKGRNNCVINSPVHLFCDL